jgi:uncharacterized protein (TIGR02265 family)
VSDDRVIFGSAAEGLIRAMGNKLDERAHHKFAQLGVPLRPRVLPVYPRKAWIDACVYAGELLFPINKPEEQRLMLGHRFISSYSETIVGKALITMLRLLGPRRSLARIERSFRTGMSHADIGLKELEPGHFEVAVANVSYSEWYQGMIEKGLELSGAKELKVTVSSREGDTVTYEVRWAD